MLIAYFLCEALKRQMGMTMNKYKRERQRQREKTHRVRDFASHRGVQKVAKRKKNRIYSSPSPPYVRLCHVVQVVGTPVTNALAKRIMCAGLQGERHKLIDKNLRRVYGTQFRIIQSVQSLRSVTPTTLVKLLTRQLHEPIVHNVDLT